MRRLPDTGLKALWALEGQSATRAELERALRDKGFASCEKRGGTNWYAPLVSQADYLSFESSAVLDKVFGKSLKRFVASLARGGDLDDAEVEELQRYLDELKEGRK